MCKSLSSKNIYNPYESKYWEKTDVLSNNCRWEPINIWSPGLNYKFDSYVIHDNIVFSALSDTQSNDYPIYSKLWKRVYSLEPDTNYVYQKYDNPLLIMNNEFYLLINNPNNKTLENGIKIYINKDEN